MSTAPKPRNTTAIVPTQAEIRRTLEAMPKEERALVLTRATLKAGATVKVVNASLEKRR